MEFLQKGMKKAHKTLINLKLSAITLAATWMSPSAFADGGLSKGKSILDGFNQDLTTIIPIAATIILVLLAVGYSAKIIQKDDLIRWGIGIILAGSAGTLAASFAG